MSNLPMIEKHCPGCQRLRSIDAFHRNKARRDGLASYCRDCFKVIDRGRYAANPVPKRLASSTYYQSNRERVDARHRRWVEENPEKQRAIYERWLGKRQHQGARA